MASGQKTVQFNTQERAVSTDLNRLQRFGARGLGEVLRYLLDVSANDDLDAGGVATEYTALASPLRAEVLGGLLVRPTPAAVTLTVDKGALYAIVPDGDADASSYKQVVDPGLTLAAPLTLTANASGSLRIDVVECSVNLAYVSETDNRDLFDAVTGLFTPTSVTKATEARLTYRIRLGTPGAGFPGTASGWLPLAVLSVPNGTTTTDTVTMWDVRPLLSDRQFQPFALAQDWPTEVEAWVDNDVQAPPVNPRLHSGQVHGIVGGRRLGGRLRGSVPLLSDQDTLDAALAGNIVTAPPFVDSTLTYLYLCAPYGLPRWARYTATGPTRVPRSPRGLPLFSSQAPDASGAPAASLSLPAALGLGTGAALPAEAVCVAATGVRTGAPYGLRAAGRMGASQYADSSTGQRTATTGQPGASIEQRWTFQPGIHFPPHARELLIDFNLEVSPTANYAGGTFSFGYSVLQTTNGVFKDSSATWDYSEVLPVPAVAGAALLPLERQMWLPIGTPYPSRTPASVIVRAIVAPSAGSWNAALGTNLAFVVGWRL